VEKHSEITLPDGGRTVLHVAGADASAPFVLVLPAMGVPAGYYGPFVDELDRPQAGQHVVLGHGGGQQRGARAHDRPGQRFPPVHLQGPEAEVYGANAHRSRNC